MSYGRRGERYRDPPIQIGIATTMKLEGNGPVERVGYCICLGLDGI